MPFPITIRPWSAAPSFAWSAAETWPWTPPALRGGSAREHVYILYRRSREEMPARTEEIHHAEQEGIIFKLLCAPLEYLSDAKGMVRQVRCQEMQLGDPDDSGRRRPLAKEGCTFTLDVDMAIIAIGAVRIPC